MENLYRKQKRFSRFIPDFERPLARQTSHAWLFILAVVTFAVAISFICAKRAESEGLAGSPTVSVATPKATQDQPAKKDAPQPQIKPQARPITGPSASQADVKAQIIAIAKEEGYQAPLYLVRLAACESGLRPDAVGDRGKSRGLFQWHSGYHPEVTDACAFSVGCSTRLTISYLINGQAHQWTCAKIIS